jgi:lysozyme
LVALAAGIYSYAIHWRPSLRHYPVQGIDVSHHQGNVDWSKVRAAGVAFAYIKATEGGDHRDADFTKNWHQSRAAGLRHGAYHFYTLCRPAADQAANFIAAVPREPDALAPVVDLEFGGNCSARPSREVLLRELTIFLMAIEQHAGRAAILYITREFDEAYGITRAFDRPLWLRRMLLPPNYGARPWTIWQASAFRSVDGIEGRVDWNVMRP